ncbi:MAG: glycosyltransferase [Rhodomicrobium sp.]|nr:glycosyltransferase [Rhodomicrobium sp.]
MISVVVPTLNAAQRLPATFQSIFDAAIDGLVSEVIVSDCGSTDATLKIAEAAGATAVAAGRGQQLLAGAQAARKPWLLFLQAGAAMESGWEDEVRRFIAQGETGAATFRFRMAGKGIRARLLEAFVALQPWAFRLPYGGQGLLISRELLDAIGGFASMPPMDGNGLVRRLGRRRVSILRAAVVASAGRVT